MRVLIGCEESGVVRNAFIRRGHDAYFNDLIPARDNGPHLQMCVTKAIKEHGPWDIIILHYDCTEMAVCANRWYAEGKPGYAKRLEALDFAESLWELAKKYARKGAAFENPASVLWTRIGKPQYIQPWQFGHMETKKTGIKTDRLPPLMDTRVVGPPLRLVHRKENHGRESGAWRNLKPGKGIDRKPIKALQMRLQPNGDSTYHLSTG